MPGLATGWFFCEASDDQRRRDPGGSARILRRKDSFKAIVNEALRRGLDRIEAPPERREPYRLRPFSPGRCLVNELDDVAGVLAVVEGDDFR